MKQYPSIETQIIRDHVMYVFDKIDGSNIRVEWSRKSGFSKYGARKTMIGEGHFLSESVDIFNRDFADELAIRFKKIRTERVTVFLEFHGENSFAGNHEDEPHKLSLIDIDLFKVGLIDPRIYIDDFGDLDIAKLLYVGKINNEVIEQVKQSELEGMTFEGVVCKTYVKKRMLMFKIKSLAWLQKLKKKCAGNEKLFNELA